MSDKKPNLLVCIVCGMCGTKDDFTPESNNTCKKCLRVCQLEQRVRYLEERSLESAMKSMEIRVSALEETMEKRVSALEEINRQKKDGDRLEKEIGCKDRQDAVKGKESAAMAVGGKVAKDFADRPLNKADLEEKINDVLEDKLYFVIGVAEREGSAKESVEKYEQRSPNLDERNIQAIRDYKVNHVKVFYGNLLSKKNACASESQQLLDKFRNCELCLNAKSGEDEWLREKDAKEGILFLHVYSV